MTKFKKSVLSVLLLLIACIAVVFGLSPIKDAKSVRADGEEAFALPINVVGGSIRLPADEEDVMGVRFLCEVQWEEYFGENFCEFDSMGVLLGLETDGALTVENNRARVEYLTGGELSELNKLNRGYVQDGRLVLDNASNRYYMIVYCYGIPTSQYHAEFSCVGYLTMGEEVVYTEPMTRSVAQVAYKAYQEATDADVKATLKAILTDEGYSHDTNEYVYDDEKHYACCSLCGYYDEEGEGEAHDMNDATGLCSVCGKGFEAAVLLDGVESFTYTTESSYNFDITLMDGGKVEYSASQEGASYATATKGYDHSVSVKDKDVINVMFPDTPWDPSPETSFTSLTDEINWYYLIENGVEYQLSYHEEFGIWEQGRLESDASFEAMKEAGLSIFRNATKKFNQFTYDGEKGTYKNTVPMSLEVKEISPDGWTITDRLDDMYFEFKIVNGKIEWMDLRANLTDVTDYTTGYLPLWTYVNGELVGRKQTETITGTVSVHYFDINATTVELPENIVLDDTVTSYPCQHENVGEWQTQAYFHMRKCSDCNRWVNYAAHDFEEGVCLDCGYICAHDVERWESTGFKHEAYCKNCNAYLVDDHLYANGVCTVCGQEECAHENKSNLMQMGSSYHGWHCMDCGSMLREKHSFENDICTVCGYEVCYHEGEHEYRINEWEHGFMCEFCGEGVYEEHTYEGEGTICTVCGFDSTCEHSNTKLGAVGAESHTDVCVDCGCEVGNMGEMHTFIDGVCTKCQYVCRHTNMNDWHQNGDNHERTCNACDKNFQEAHDFGDDGVCVKCSAIDCDHLHLSERFPQNNDFHAIRCEDCWVEFPEPHTFVDEICTDCNYKLCHHENVRFEIYERHHSGSCPDCYEWINGEHTFEGTVCTVCGYDSSCQHTTMKTTAIDEYRHGLMCTACGLIDEQERTSEHVFESGVCTGCKYECSHNVSWNSDENEHYGTCNNCRMEIRGAHVAPEGEWEHWEEMHYQYCTVCNNQIPPEPHVFEESVCTVCHYECGHSYEDSICRRCGAKCLHEGAVWVNRDDVQHYKHCSICDNSVYESHTSSSDEWVIRFNRAHAKVCDVCGGSWARTDHVTDENGVCTDCGLNTKCTHEGEEVVISYHPAFYEGVRDWQHAKYYPCCDVYIEEDHTFEDSVCIYCYHECPHSGNYTPSETTGEHVATCGTCGYSWTEDCTNLWWIRYVGYHEYICQECNGLLSSGGHVIDGDGYCVDCGYDSNCQHDSECYQNISDTQHRVVCNHCQAIIGYEEHVYIEDGSFCQCGYRCGHESDNYEVTYEPNEGSNTHTCSCTHCDAVWTNDHQIDYNTYEKDESGHYYVCTVCGAKVDEAAHSFNPQGLCEYCCYQQTATN